jgi:hypothetical protein
VGDKQAYSYIDAETNKNKFSQLSIDVPLEPLANIDLCESQILAHLRIKTELFALRQLYFDGSGAK